MLDISRRMHLSFVFKDSIDSFNSWACSHFLLESVHCTLYNDLPVQSYFQWSALRQCVTVRIALLREISADGKFDSGISCSSKMLQKVNSGISTLRATGSLRFTILFCLGGPQDLRLGLIAFRDHPPQEHSFLIQEYPFTSDFGSFASNLASLRVEGGGDEPDVQGDALAAAYNAGWRAEARKIVVLITDSPPHGIGEDGDAFPKGCPLRKCSLVIMDQPLTPN